MFCFKSSRASKFENNFTWKQKTKTDFSSQQPNEKWAKSLKFIKIIVLFSF